MAEEKTALLAFTATDRNSAVIWQKKARSQLMELVAAQTPQYSLADRPLDFQVRASEDRGDYTLYHASFVCNDGERRPCYWTVPKGSGPFPTMLCLHGHAGSAEVVFDAGTEYAAFGDRFARAGYCVLAPTFPHRQYAASTLWDLIRCIDVLDTREEVDRDRIGVMGLSMGGEWAMYAAACNPRIKAAVISGWMCTNKGIDSVPNCSCWKLPGLLERMDVADIHLLIAPRPMLFESAEEDIYLPIADSREGFRRIRAGYAVFGAEEACVQDVFPGGHAVHGVAAYAFMDYHVAGRSRYLPPESLNLTLTAPIDTWDEAIPLGNGILGGLLWGSDQKLRLSLDRGDLWDLRQQNAFLQDDSTWANIQKLVSERNQPELARRYETPYHAPWPTKLPGGRLEIVLDPSQRVNGFSLDLAHAIGRATLQKGHCDVFFSAVAPVALIRIPGPAPKEVRLLSPMDVFRSQHSTETGPSSGGSVDALGYPKAQVGHEGAAQWYLQEAAGGLTYCVCVESQRLDTETLLAVAICTNGNGKDPVAEGRTQTSAALKQGYDASLAPHVAWWHDFWGQSRVDIPDLNHLRHYYLVQYFYGAASRLGAPPIPLQGVWTADNGGLPPWKGDYHHNLNTQMTYAAYQTAGRFDEGRCFLEFLWNLLPEFRGFAQKFYEAPGAAVPGVMTLDGKPLGGWVMYSMQPTNAAWLGYLFYQHWLYTADETFLRERAYPWCSEIGQCLLHLLKPDADGILKLPLSSSPEIHDNRLEAWLRPNSNYDHDCMAALFAAIADMAETLGKTEDASRWREAVARLGARAVDPQSHRLLLGPGEALTESHRHLAHTMSIHPFGLLNTDGSDQDREVIAASLQQYDELGTSLWCGYSFSWMACLRARVGDAEAAIQNLDIYEKAFILRNGFHANGDQTNAGYSNFHYRPFTLEGNFLASQAIHEMLLQSWGDVIRIFPAVPDRWRDASFEDLRAEGGYRVSARRTNGATESFMISACQDGLVKIRDNFGGRQPRWSRNDVEKVGNHWQVVLKAGESLESRF